MGLSVGIDLGTTNSVIAVKQLDTKVLKNGDGDMLTPSSVSILPAQGEEGVEIVVGRKAREQIKQYPENTITSVKRLMGRDGEDPAVQRVIAQRLYGYTIVTGGDDPDRGESLMVRCAGRLWTPDEISALILQKVTQDGGATAGSGIDQAVVTVPAYFTDKQKYATRRAMRTGRAQTIAPSARTLRPRRLVSAWIRWRPAKPKRSWFSIWAAGRSIYPSWVLPMAALWRLPKAATCGWGATTSIT